MTALYILKLALTFTVFCGVVAKLERISRPSFGAGHWVRWVAWGAIHVGIAIGMLGIFFENFGDTSAAAPWHLWILRFSLAGYFMLERRNPLQPQGHSPCAL